MSMNMYLKLDGILTSGIAGRTVDATIEIQSFSWGVSRSTPSNSSGSGAGKVTMNSISISKHLDAASVQLFAAAASGRRIASGLLTILPAVQLPAVQFSAKYTFENMVISSFESEGNAAGGNMPTEVIKFEFNSVLVSTTAITNGG